ncbi:MAG: vitamin K epoxide reductase family protein [Desulfobacteraceae bacterium]
MCKKPEILLPFKYYYTPLFITAIIGFLSAVYLSLSHYRVYTDIGYKSFCAVSRAINCDTVSQSAYSILLNVPVPVWGIYGYGFVLFLVILAGLQQTPKNRLWPLIFWVMALFSAYSIVLAAVSTFLIDSYCLMCVVTYLVNFTLMYWVWFVNKRFGSDGIVRGFSKDLRYLFSLKKITVPVFAMFLVAGSGMILGFPQYWDFKPAKLSHSIPRGVTADGHPWMGAEDPELIIEEYSDYLCFYCRKMHYYLRALVETNPDKIRLVHYHFPMDHRYNPIVREPYHVGSGLLAALAIHASKHDKFWEANDLFLSIDPEIGKVNIGEIAMSLGLDKQSMVESLNTAGIFQDLQKDIRKGLQLGVTGTPGFVIDGRLYQGQIPPEVLRRFIS